MKIEIDRLPIHKKEALMEAQGKCRPYEFSNERLEKFLRCDGMNPELAALRFVDYWEKRREVFGRDKYTMRMTLSEALRDDLVALETGVFSLLPHKDLSGRQLMYFNPHRHTREGYTSESLLRAVWYMIEVASADTTDTKCGIVEVVWNRDVTFWDYDQKVYERLLMLFQHSLPVRSIALHVCCPSKMLVRVAFPVIRALQDKASRARTKEHDVPESEIIQVLEEYGITREMLPSEMGGSLQLDQLEWLADRRSVEMEEI